MSHAVGDFPESAYLSAYETQGIPVDGGYVVEDLRAIAFRVGIPGYRGMRKNELIHVLNNRLDETRQPDTQEER